MSTTYNGWTNYETWVVNLWLTNDEGSYSYWTDRAEAIIEEHDEDDPPFSAREIQIRELADALACMYRENMPVQENMPAIDGVYFDLLMSALEQINWREIAESLIDGAEG